MDPLTDLFNTMHVASVVQARLEATAPWGLMREAEDAKEGVPPSSALKNSPSLLAHFGMVSRGNCWLSVRGMPDPIPLTGGDCFLLAPASSYALRDNPRTRARSFCEVAPKNRSNVIHYGGGGAPTTVIATLQLLASEMAQPAPGSEVMVNRLADILFIQCVRAHIASSSETCKSGWLRAIFDPRIGAVLNAMHERIENPWTVETLAAAAGMSRSAFALRFKELVGETPLEYLTNWRMYKATGLLQEDHRKLFEVANSVGYDSDAAFSKAFKRVLGVTPKQYRRNATESHRN